MNTNEWDLTKKPENIEIPSKFPGVVYSFNPHYLRRPCTRLSLVYFT